MEIFSTVAPCDPNSAGVWAPPCETAQWPPPAAMTEPGDAARFVEAAPGYFQWVVIIAIALGILWIIRKRKKLAAKELVEADNPIVPPVSYAEAREREKNGAPSIIATVTAEKTLEKLASGVFVKAEGWYPTPDGKQERYWNGLEWTEEHRPATIHENPEAAPADERLSEEEIAALIASGEVTPAPESADGGDEASAGDNPTTLG